MRPTATGSGSTSCLTGERDIQTVLVPFDVARKATPFGIKFKAQVLTDANAMIEIDGGAVFKTGKNFNVASSPSWDRFFSRRGGGLMYSEEEAKKTVEAKDFDLQFLSLNQSNGGLGQTISFDLSEVKLWYADQQRDKYKQQICKSLLGTYTYLSHRTNDLADRQQRVTMLCENLDNASVRQLEKEVAFLDDYKAPSTGDKKTKGLLKMAKIVTKRKVDAKKAAVTKLEKRELERQYKSEHNANIGKIDVLRSNLQQVSKKIEQAKEKEEIGKEIQIEAYAKELECSPNYDHSIYIFKKLDSKGTYKITTNNFDNGKLELTTVLTTKNPLIECTSRYNTDCIIRAKKDEIANFEYSYGKRVSSNRIVIDLGCSESSYPSRQLSKLDKFGIKSEVIELGYFKSNFSLSVDRIPSPSKKLK